MPPTIMDALTAQVAGYVQKQVNPETRLEDLNLDSLDVLDLAVTLEDRFEVVFPDGELEQWETVGDIGRALERLYVDL